MTSRCTKAKHTHGFRWSRTGIRRVWNSWAGLSGTWPSCGWVCFSHRYPSCTPGLPGRICSCHSWCTRRLFRERRRTRIDRCRRSPQSQVLKKKYIYICRKNLARINFITLNVFKTNMNVFFQFFFIEKPYNCITDSLWKTNKRLIRTYSWWGYVEEHEWIIRFKEESDGRKS